MFSQTSQSLPDTLLSFPICPTNYATKSMHLNYPWLDEKFLLSAGVMYLADKARAFWLVDAIAAQQKDAQVASASLQVWELIVDAGHKVTLIGADDRNHIRAYQEIPKTDFPVEHLCLIAVRDAFLGGRMLMLACEYHAYQSNLRIDNFFQQAAQPAWAV